ncbi:TonB-dependent copper receptor [Dyella sp. M7H15-1]|uniref:TonB-dependent copper receptor n=1 Tax=Dyella sp. M7H15-1 TaxID=2501295 RepID=UPI001004E289|nr:TonB-dependent copper receptor [Dyella sp. M7H15-1]QAU23984.1 TonB-dependent copper receptor [Dyella sp. M7H15-1]
MTTFYAGLLSPCALACAVALALTGTAHADDNADKNTHTLTPVVVTATMQDSPLIVVTDPKQPRQPVPASDGADFLKSIPGFSTIRKGGSNGDPLLRGMSGSRLNILVDGGMIAGGCPSRMDPPTAYIAPQLYDRVTLIKGPETVLYGPGNSAGVVLFDRNFERYTQPTLSGDASLLFGSAGRSDQNLDLRAGDSTGYIGISTNHTHSQDYKDGDGNRVHSQYDRWNADATIGWTPSDQTRIELTVGKGNGDAAYAFSRMDGVQFLRESTALKWTQEHLTTHWEKLEVQAYTNYADHVMDNYTLRTPDPASMMPMAMAADVDRRTSGGRATGTWRWGDALELQAGVDGSVSVHTHRAGGPPGSMMGYYKDQPRMRDARMQDIGIFAETRWSFAQSQRLVTGVRVDRVQTRGYTLEDMAGMEHMESMSGVDAMAMMPAQTAADRGDTLPSGFVRYESDLSRSPTTFYAGMGHVERFPDYWELFGQHVEGTLDSFRALQPERTTQWDIGMQYHGDRVKAWVSAYAGVVNDFILMHYPMTSMGVDYASNVQARIAGGEAGANYDFTSHWKADVTVSYAWGENLTENRPLPQMPPFEARWGLTYEATQWSIGALWRLATAQHRVADDEGNIVGQDLGPSAGFGVFSFNGAYRIDRRFTLSAGIDNLFNKTYAEHVNAAAASLAGYVNTTRVNEPGRTLWIKLDAKL